MDRSTIRQRLHHLIDLDDLHSWDVEKHIDQLATLDDAICEEVFRQIVAIWPVSYALCFAFLDQLPKGLACLAPHQLPEWVNAVLDVYESGGLQAANRFLTEVESNFLCRLRGESGLPLDEAAGRLRLYLRGLAGYDLDLAEADQCATDTATVFLPAEVSLFKKKEENFLFYKLAASIQWALLTTGTFRLAVPPADPLIADLQRRYGKKWGTGKAWLANFFALFPEPLLAADLFLLAEAVRATAYLGRLLPGLLRDAEPTLKRLLRQRPDCTTLTGKGLVVEGIRQWLLAGHSKGLWPSEATQLYRAATGQLQPLTVSAATAYRSARATTAIAMLLDTLPGPYHPNPPLTLVGRLQPERAEERRRQRREENRERFVTAMAALLPELQGKGAAAAEKEAPAPAGQTPLADEAVLLPPGQGEEKRQPVPDHQGPQSHIIIDDTAIELPEAVQPLARRIRDDLGHIPREYISAAGQRAGSGIAIGPGPAGEDEGGPAIGPLVYDEWDFRRSGFRKNWCTLLTKELDPVQSTFVPATLEKYRGELRRLRRQFEMMRSRERFVKRQRDGDDIDLDALIEARADSLAGRSATERLYVRLRRDQRDISAVFLVDMSSSTEGWVNTAIKEALVLMCEALEMLGDRYAIYGFSGMRRLRSELYRIKEMDEAYDDTVRGRIAAIAPREYTRMGPPIRHLTRLLAAGDAKVRLLITLSDGKPEDYDDYKGDYAVEDTRHALIEAKAAGIHPFCITIDRQAHDYIAHMYGEVNYIFIDQVRRLPHRMPQVYRALTS